MSPRELLHNISSTTSRSSVSMGSLYSLETFRSFVSLNNWEQTSPGSLWSNDLHNRICNALNEVVV